MRVPRILVIVLFLAVFCLLALHAFWLFWRMRWRLMITQMAAQQHHDLLGEVLNNPRFSQASRTYRKLVRARQRARVSAYALSQARERFNKATARLNNHLGME